MVEGPFQQMRGGGQHATVLVNLHQNIYNNNNVQKCILEHCRKGYTTNNVYYYIILVFKKCCVYLFRAALYHLIFTVYKVVLLYCITKF